MRNLNVIRTCHSEISTKWRVSLPFTYAYKEIFIRCNAKGIVNWDKSPIYTREELNLRGNYTVLKRDNAKH